MVSEESQPEVDASTGKGDGAELGQEEQDVWLQRALAGQYTRVKCAHPVSVWLVSMAMLLCLCAVWHRCVEFCP